MTEQMSQSAWVNWSYTMMNEYRPMLSSIMRTLQRLPRFSQFILPNDVEKLKVIAVAFDIDLSRRDLFDHDDFTEVLGECMRYIMRFLHTDLRPSDPLLEKIEKLSKNKMDVDTVLEAGNSEL